MSENESDILSMADSDIEYLTPAEAQGHIDQVLRAGKEHPYWDGSNIKAHRVAYERMQRLFQIVSPDELQTNAEGEVLVQQFPREVVKAMAEGLEIQDAKRAKLLARAQADMDALVNKHDFAWAEIPENLQLWEADLLHAERLNQEATPENLHEISAILEREAQGVPFDPELREAISHLSAARLALNKFGPKQFSEIAEGIIHLINKGHEKTQKKGRKYGA